MPILVMLLALKIRLFETKTSSRLWSTSVMDPPSASSGGRLLLPCLVCIPKWLLLVVSIVGVVLQSEVTSPTPNPPPFSTWLGTGFRCKTGSKTEGLKSAFLKAQKSNFKY